MANWQTDAYLEHVGFNNVFMMCKNSTANKVT